MGKTEQRPEQGNRAGNTARKQSKRCKGMVVSDDAIRRALTRHRCSETLQQVRAWQDMGFRAFMTLRYVNQRFEGNICLA